MFNYQDRDAKQSLVLTYHSMGVSNYTHIVDNKHQSFPLCLVCCNIGVHFLLDVRSTVAFLCEFDFDCEIHCFNCKVRTGGSWPNQCHFFVSNEINTNGVQDVLDHLLDLCFITLCTFME